MSGAILGQGADNRHRRRRHGWSRPRALWRNAGTVGRRRWSPARPARKPRMAAVLRGGLV